MKVLHVIPSVSDRSGGPAQAIFPMCRALQANGIQTLIATTNDGVDLNGNGDGVVEYKNVSTVFFPSQWGKSFKFSRPMAVWLDENVRQFDLVHIHAVFNHACLTAARACRKHRVPYVVRPLGTLEPWSMRQKSLKKRLFWRLGAKRMVTGANAVHYTSSAEKETTEEGLKLGRGKVVPLGIDLEISESANARVLLSEEFPELMDYSYVLVLSRLHPKKGLNILLDAFFSLRTIGALANWRLVLAGDGPMDHVNELKERVRAHDGSSLVYFPGWLSAQRKAVILRNSSLLALPSYQENFGVCVIEAMASGIPVLISPHVGLSDQVANAEAGWITNVDVESVRNGLLMAMESEAERTRRGNAGRVLATKFSWQSVGQSLTALYGEIVDAGERRFQS